MTLARATVVLLVALLLAVAATAHWLDRRAAKRLRVVAAELRTEAVGMRSSVAELRTEAVGMRSSVAELRTEAVGMRSSIAELRTEAVGIRSSIAELRTEAAGIRSNITELRNEIASLRSGNRVSLQPTSIELGPADTYERLDQNWKSNAETSERSVVPCNDGGPLRPLVILTLGQSNAANHGQGLYVPKHRVDNFNLYDGKCYKAVEPLLGPSGQGGNFATRLADMLIERQLANRVVLAPIAMGGTSVEQWAHEGLFNRRITTSIRRLYDAGLSADYILWHQGEGNLGIGDSGGRQYRKNLLEVVASFRTYSVNAPFFVALTTRCAKSPHPNAVNVRDGQRTAAIGQLGIFVGPDTDLIGAEHRYDDCHMSESGLTMHAAAWADILHAFIKRGGEAARAR
jgi:Carbohydrate esterase, sialic acid-specific acetylesterase